MTPLAVLLDFTHVLMRKYRFDPQVPDDIVACTVIGSTKDTMLVSEAVFQRLGNSQARACFRF